jgi:predicted transcriptional regulator
MGKYTIQINSEVEKLLDDLGAASPEDRATLIQKALASYIYLKQQSSAPNLNVSLTDADQRILKNIDLP